MRETTYKKQLGWLNVDERPSQIDGTVFRTSDGRAWMTRRGVPVVVPDDYENHGLSDDEVAPLPDELDIARCSRLREPPKDFYSDREKELVALVIRHGRAGAVERGATIQELDALLDRIDPTGERRHTGPGDVFAGHTT